MPNKLVKRSLSQRALSHYEAQGQILKRPVTSHQRTETFRAILKRPATAIQDTNNAITPPSTTSVTFSQKWRPYFETTFPRKRRKSEPTGDPTYIRVLTLSAGASPTLILGPELDQSSSPADIYNRPQPIPEGNATSPFSVRRPKRSLTAVKKITRRRTYTDPSVFVTHMAAQGTFAPANGLDLNPTVQPYHVFNMTAPPGSPKFNSSPPNPAHNDSRPYWSRRSISASDPPTIGSDTDGRVFSDIDSMEFQSDTAYDSIATRATTLSFSGNHESKLETIFAAKSSSDEAETERWRHTNQDLSMEDSPFNITINKHNAGAVAEPADISNRYMAIIDSPSKQTPPRTPSFMMEDINRTPVPLRRSNPENLNSSPPLIPVTKSSKHYEEVGDMLNDMNLDDDDDLDWSIEEMPANKRLTFTIANSDNDEDLHSSPHQEDGKTQVTSIFEWSEHQPMQNFSRPKTVDGKKLNGDRSRPSGRKGLPQLHYRSQSVPVNRDGPPEDVSASKYQTWKFGYKPVSEEWSDDFDFDDNEQNEMASPVIHDGPQNFRDSVRSVRIPQAIMDRQPSVHLQFGQVQEFMALVEEMKRLRTRAAELAILNGTAKSLWEDAESVINLATINDDEELIPPMTSSPASSDPFAELPPIVTQHTQLPRVRRPTANGRRSVSAMTPPQLHTRARGESLAHARTFLQAIHQNRDGFHSSPRDIEIQHQQKLPFDTQDLKDLVVRSGAITRALKEEIRRAEGLNTSPTKTPPRNTPNAAHDHPLSEIFRIPPPQEASPLFNKTAKPILPKSRSANSYLETVGSRSVPAPFSSPMSLTAIV